MAIYLKGIWIGSLCVVTLKKELDRHVTLEKRRIGADQKENVQHCIVKMTRTDSNWLVDMAMDQQTDQITAKRYGVRIGSKGKRIELLFLYRRGNTLNERERTRLHINEGMD